jgi:hypothetical protein
MLTIHSPATERQRLLAIAANTLEMLQSDAFPAAVTESVFPAVAGGAIAHRDIVVNALSSALDWARLEKLAGESGDTAAPQEGVAGASKAPPYIPSNQVLSLLQSAYDEYQEARAQDITEVPFDTSDPGWLTIALEKLKALARGKHTFIKHTSPDSFQIEMPEDAVVALFGDWGTGEPTAERVMDQIKLRQPTHAVHLGDIYYSGTPKEGKQRFLDVIDQHGPPPASCRYFSLNGNHDMYSGGYGYFDTVLASLGQPASYFNLRNANWQLIGLDSGYEDNGLQDPQKDWLAAQVAPQGSRKTILMSHHQAFSPYESRAQNRTLLKKVTPMLAQIDAWFWGHEHKCIILADHMGIKGRCVGHGAVPANVPYGTPPFPEVPILKVDERSGPPPDGGVIHGFALLKFTGLKIDVSYIDEFGTEFFAEQLGS